MQLEMTIRARRIAAIPGAALFTLLAAGPAHAEFPSAFNLPPAGWTGPVFKLSQAYPASLPALEPAAKRKWTSFNFREPAQAPDYLKAVLDYCLEGNTSTNAADNFADVGANPVRKWYHAPWLHTTASGREFVHGMTRERASRPRELGPLQTGQFNNWAVGFYNARGGYTIGQVWKNPAEPDPRKSKFASHTVACKMLFTTTPLAQAPFLEGSLEWEADINRGPTPGPRPKLRLLQIDVAVKDPRASSTIGWVFGTFQYEKNASTSPDWWQHMVPVGLMWGNDVVKLVANQPTRTQWINTSRGQQLHLGFRGLLNGPVDNPMSSCTACHGLGQIASVASPQPAIPGIPSGSPSDDVIRRYFKNMKSNEGLSGDYISTDYSLQLQLGISRALAANAAHLPANVNTHFLIFRGPPAAETVPAVGREE